MGVFIDIGSWLRVVLLFAGVRALCLVFDVPRAADSRSLALFLWRSPPFVPLEISTGLREFGQIQAINLARSSPPEAGDFVRLPVPSSQEISRRPEQSGSLA